jgi:cytochrome c-type biogenesis protein CcmH
MSSRDWFWFLAGVLVTVTVLVTLRAWTRERPAQAVQGAIPGFAVPIAAALGMVGVALGIYFLLGSPGSITSVNSSPNPPEQTPSAQKGQSTSNAASTTNAGSLDDVTQKLANRLATQGGSDSEWQLLAQSYDYMGRAADAKAARAHKATAAPLSADGSAASGASAGWSGGADAGAEGARADAATGVNMDGQTMASVADALDSGRTRVAAVAGGASGGGMSAGGASPESNATATPAAGTAQVSGTIEISPKLAAKAPEGATLFIYAKQPNTPGPPLAVMRMRAEHWPIKFTLSDANAMVPGRNLSNAQTVQIEARISRSGEALPQSGDLVGTVTNVNPRASRPVKISIDREIG